MNRTYGWQKGGSRAARQIVLMNWELRLGGALGTGRDLRRRRSLLLRSEAILYGLIERERGTRLNHIKVSFADFVL